MTEQHNDAPDTGSAVPQGSPTPFTPLSPTPKKGAVRIGKKILSVALTVFGVVAGAIGGFMIMFDACFKQSCSPVEETAVFTVPIATLFLTIPLAHKLVGAERGALWKVLGISVGVVVLLVAGLYLMAFTT